MKNSVCAVIVTWNSGDDINLSLPTISPQVEMVVVVDNGSRPEELAIVQTAAKKFPNAVVIENPKNEGIAKAFNLGADYAKKHDLSWVVTLDDAAKPEPQMVEKLLAAYHRLTPENQKKTAIIAPNYSTLKGPVYAYVDPYFVQTAVATGQMIKTDVWHDVGGQKEDLFITAVDHEFCFRMLRAGYKTLLVPKAMLVETAGPNPIVRQILWKKFVVPNYSADRYYYMYRNSIYLYKTYWRYVPGWIIRNIGSNILSYFKILLCEENPAKKTWMIIRGNIDGLSNRYGPLKKA
jgi:rhamnosyltransferase